MMPEACAIAGQQIKSIHARRYARRYARNPSGGLPYCATFQNRTAIGSHVWVRLFREPLERPSFDLSVVFPNEL
jgi:hypothetical protein